MTKEINVKYCFMVGNLYISKVSESALELSAYIEDAYTIENTDLYRNDAMRHTYIEKISELLRRMESKGIKNVEIIELKEIVEIVEREVELTVVGDKLKLLPVKDERTIDGLGDDKYGTAIINNVSLGWFKKDEE